MPIILNNITNPEDVVAINNNFDKIEQAWDEKLDRFVSLQGNEMNQDMDMNGKAILNVHVNDEPRSLVNKEYVDNKIQSYEAALLSAKEVVNAANALMEEIVRRSL